MLVVFDVEGVLLDAEYLPVLAKLIGKEKEIMDITIQGLRGEIPWKEGSRPSFCQLNEGAEVSSDQ